MPPKLSELDEVLYSNSLTYGKWGKAFEKKISEYTGGANVGIVSSFNYSILIILKTFGVKQGDEIIASPMSCLASNQPIIALGVKVVWADVDARTGTLNPDTIKNKLTSKTKAIFHNHHCGYPGYIEEINSIAKAKGIIVIDDAIEAFGAEYKGRKIGNTGSDATVFSFHTVRLPNTIDGGAFIIKDHVFFEKAKRIRDLGIDRKLFRNDLKEISTSFDVVENGFGATMSEFNSYIGCMQMENIDDLLNRQKSNADSWERKIKREFREYEIVKEVFHRPNYWVYGVLVNNKEREILRHRKIGYYASGVHYPNYNYSVFGRNNDLPGVEEFYSKFIALPCGWWFNL